MTPTRQILVPMPTMPDMGTGWESLVRLAYGPPSPYPDPPLGELRRHGATNAGRRSRVKRAALRDEP